MPDLDTSAFSPVLPHGNVHIVAHVVQNAGIGNHTAIIGMASVYVAGSGAIVDTARFCDNGGFNGSEKSFFYCYFLLVKSFLNSRRSGTNSATKTASEIRNFIVCPPIDKTM